MDELPANYSELARVFAICRSLLSSYVCHYEKRLKCCPYFGLLLHTLKCKVICLCVCVCVCVCGGGALLYNFFVIPFYSQSVIVQSGNYVKTYTVACGRVLSSAPL
jgi:hypothetical protein